MGSIADMILEGLLCQQCNAVLEDGEAPGHPRTCADCSGSDKAARRGQAAIDWTKAFIAAKDSGMTLKQHSDQHYQLSHPDGWLLNIYPGNRRLYHDKNRKGPFLQVPLEWTLLDVVNAAAKQGANRDHPN